jgi:small-conductance mechanosensitive channel
MPVAVSPVPRLAVVLAQVGEGEAVQVFGVTLVGVSTTTGVKLVFTLGLLVIAWIMRAAVIAVLRRLLGGDVADPRRFWSRQVVRLGVAAVVLLGTVSIWVTPQTDLSTGIGLVTAGLAFALQKVIVAFAGYFVILRRDTFGVGDRITLGGVRGDVVRLGFLRTTIMEMGQPPSVSAAADPAVWVHSRQYTGRLVTVSNGVIFDEPVYNYTRDFPYLWEEISIPLPFTVDRRQVESVMLTTARAHAVVEDEQALQALDHLRRRYAMAEATSQPRTYWRITGSCLELSVRFLTTSRGVREVKDRITRQLLDTLDAAEIGLAPSSVRVVGTTRLQVEPP